MMYIATFPYAKLCVVSSVEYVSWELFIFVAYRLPLLSLRGLYT